MIIKFNPQIEDSLRILGYLYSRAQSSDVQITAVRLSKALQLPLENMLKLIRKLSKKKLINAHRGRAGGFSHLIKNQTMLDLAIVFAEEDPELPTFLAQPLIMADAHVVKLFGDLKLRDLLSNHFKETEK